MTSPDDRTTPYTPGSPSAYTPAPAYPTDAPTPEARKKSSLPLIIGGIVAVVIVIVATVIATMTFSGGSKPAAAPRPAAALDGAAPAATAEPEPVVTTAGPVLTAADIELSTKTTEKHCFGSAGCNVTLKIVAGWVPTLSPDETWQVTYQIAGDEDGPLIGTFEVTGDKYEANSEVVSTPSSKTKITIKVTDVEKVGV